MHDYLYDNVDHRLGASRPRLLNNHDELGLILFYLGSSMTLSDLCLIFGCTPTRCSLVINRELPFSPFSYLSLQEMNAHCFESKGM